MSKNIVFAQFLNLLENNFLVTELVVLDRGNLNAHRYSTNILEPVVVPYAPFVGQDFIYMHDNGRPHIAKVI
jgi:hypothetical protein